MGIKPSRKPAPKGVMPKESRGWFPYAIGAMVVLLIALVVTGLMMSGGGTAYAPPATEADQSAAVSDPLLAGVKTYEETANHVQGAVTYDVTPPVGGDHNPVWLNCGVYDFQVPNENAVHALEHGAVWITYDPAQVTGTDLDTLKSKVNLTYEILSPYEGLPAPVVASAWGKQLHLTGVNDPALPLFIQAYRQGAQTPEPGAPCTGGTNGQGSTGTSMNADGSITK